MIDLSFLTEEEQETIMKVLQRDAALKRVEDERVRRLPEKIKDGQQLKNMSGQWFYEVKAKRHRDKIHGTDIIRASMRKKRLQVAAEQSEDRENGAKESWVNNVNKDAFPPPELAEVVEEPEEDVGPASPSSSVVHATSTMIDPSPENSRSSAVSPAKQRKNPFNSSKLPEDHSSQQTKNEQSENGRTGFFQTSKEGAFSGSKEKSSILYTSSQQLEQPKQVFPGPEGEFQIKAPIPKARKMIYKSHDFKQDDSQSLPGQRTDALNTRGAPRGILKRNSSSSSTDSETVRFHQNFEPKSKIVSPGLTIHEKISEKELSLEGDSSSNSPEPLKHVRFSAVKDDLLQDPGLIHGREVGEFSVLEPARLKNGAEDVRDMDEFWKDPKSSQHREPLPLHQSDSSPSALKNETHQPKTSGSFPVHGHPSPLEVLTARRQSSENVPTIDEHKAKSSELSRLESKLSKSPADELSRVEAEPSQGPDCSSRDHQQGKPPPPKALKAKTFSCSGPQATEIRKPTDDSISKVLDWFSRSCDLEDNKSLLQHLQGIEPKEKADSESQIATALVTDDISLKENVYEKDRGDAEVNFDTSKIVKKPSLKDNMKAEREDKGGDTYILRASAEPGDTDSLPEAAKNTSVWKKPEVQLQETSEVSKDQVQREKYKRVSDRISFWEGEKAAPKLAHKELVSSHSQRQPSAKADQPVKSMDTLSTGQNAYNQVAAKQEVLDEDGQAAHLSSSYSSEKPEGTIAQIPHPAKKYPPTDQSSQVSLLQKKINEPIKRLPVADNLHSGRDITLPALQHPSNAGSEMRTSLEKDRSLMDQSNPNFKVMSLKERIDEPNTEHVYTHSQFENLKKFWDLGANSNSQDNVEKNTIKTSPPKSVLFNSHKHEEFSDIKSSGENAHEIKMLLSPPKVPAAEEIEELNSKCTLQVLPHETTFLLKPPTESTHQLPGNESSKENEPKNMEWFVTPVFKEEKDHSGQEIQESIVKTSVRSKDHKDTLNVSLQKLLSEASSPAIQPSGEKVHGTQALELGVTENGTCPQKADFADTEEASKGPKDIVNEHVDKTVAPPKVKPNTLAARLENLLKEGAVTLPSPLKTKLEPNTPRINSEPEESRVLKKGIERSHNSPAYQRERIAPFPEGKDTLGKTAPPQETESGECPPNMENLFMTAAAGGSYPSDQPSHLHRKSSFGTVASSPQGVLSSSDAYPAPQDKALPSQREITETVEKVIVPPKPALKDVNVVLQKLLTEAWLSYPVGREVKEFPQGTQAVGSLQNSPGVIPPSATMDTTVPDRKAFYSFSAAPDKTNKSASYLAAPVPPSEQTLSSLGVPVDQGSKELPQEVAEMVRETIIQRKSELLEFSAGLEKLLKETKATLTSEYESETGSTEVARPAASEFHPEEVKEIVRKTEAPSVTESAFDTGFEKLLKEASEAPSDELQASVKEDPPRKQTSESEQNRFLGRAQESLEIKLNSNVFKSQGNQRSHVLRGEATTDLSVDLHGSGSGVAIIPGAPYVDHELETIETIKPPEPRDSESEVAGVREVAFQKPGFERGPETIRVSRNRQPAPLLTNKENCTKTSQVKLIMVSPGKKQEKEEEKEGVSDSDFSDGNVGSNAESWRNTSSSEEEPSPVLKTLERSAARKMPSKSLEDISSDLSNQAKIDNLPEELVHSAEDDQKAVQEPDTNECIPGISTVPSQPDNQFSYPNKIKRMSKSVPAFLQDETDDRETDTASESSYQLSRHKKSPSSLTNLSSSSGMTSLSSVSGSVMSVYSGDFGNLEVKGSIQFAVDYVDSLKELHIFVAQCKDLAAADNKKQRSDPYVKTYLLPDKGKMGKKKTLVVKKTLNPVYNEILRYKVEKQILKTQKLNLSVWHRDTFKRNSFLGEVELDFETWDWDNKQNKQLKWYPLKRKTAPVALEAENRGEMKLALQYVPEPIPGKKLPTTGEVHIWVKECIDLPLLRGSHLSSFVKCTILPDTSRKSRQKTRAVGKTTNPVFNHTMVYDGFRPEDLTEACVELTVWDHYKLTNQFLGGLRIGFGTGKSYGTEVDWMDSTSEEVALWEKMVNSPNTWIEATLPLRMLLIAKISK